MIRWWCSGQVAVPWDWTPRPYLGIWLVMAGLAIGYLGMARRGGPVVEERASRGQLAAFSIGWVLLWASTDWPIGTLAAGYLLTASMVQIVLYYYVVAPLFVYGIPRRIRTRWLEGRYAAPLKAPDVSALRADHDLRARREISDPQSSAESVPPSGDSVDAPPSGWHRSFGMAPIGPGRTRRGRGGNKRGRLRAPFESASGPRGCVQTHGARHRYHARCIQGVTSFHDAAWGSKAVAEPIR